MMLKNSYFDFSLLKFKLSKSAWILTLYSVILFFAIPVADILQIQNLKITRNYNQNGFEEHVRSVMTNLFSINNKIIAFLVVAFAVLAAISVFYYLNSKKQVDFYHSLPVRREKIFFVSYLSGFLYFALPYIGCTIIALLITKGSEFSAYVMLSSVISNMLIFLLYYLVIYTICVLACVLCGNMIVAILGSSAFLFYLPAINAIWFATMSHYYNTFYTGYYNAEALLRNSSPILDIFIIKNGGVSLSRIIFYVIITAIVIAVSVLLYKKRPSEAAEHAIAFNVSRPIIKFPLVFLAALCGGLFFQSLGNSTGWLIFGYISGGIITHMVIEIIYNFDFKAIIKNLKWLLVFSAGFAAMILIMAFDVTGFDKRLPDEASIKSVSVNLGSMDRLANSLTENKNTYLSRERNILNKFTFNNKENIDSVLNLAMLGINGISNEPDKNKTYERAGIVFNLSNGNKIIREYNIIDREAAEKYLMSIYDTDEYKDKLFSILNSDSFDASEVKINCTYFNNNRLAVADVNDNKKAKEFADAAVQDLRDLKARDIKHSYPHLLLEFKTTELNVYNESITIPVYEESPHVNSLIEKYHINIPKPIKSDKVDQITIDITGLINNYALIGEQAIQYKMGEGQNITFNDKTEIANILPLLVPAGSCDFNPFINADYSYSVMVNSESYLNGYHESFFFLKDRVPEFVKESVMDKVNKINEDK